MRGWEGTRMVDDYQLFTAKAVYKSVLSRRGCVVLLVFGEFTAEHGVCVHSNHKYRRDFE